MNKKHWSVTGYRTTFYITIVATDNFDTEGVLQRLRTINIRKGILPELKRLFPTNLGFEVSSTPPGDSQLVQDLLIN